MNLNELNFINRKRKYDQISGDYGHSDDYKRDILSKNEDEILTRAFPNGSLISLTSSEKSKLYKLMKWLANKLDIDGHESNVFQASFN